MSVCECIHIEDELGRERERDDMKRKKVKAHPLYLCLCVYIGNERLRFNSKLLSFRII